MKSVSHFLRVVLIAGLTSGMLEGLSFTNNKEYDLNLIIRDNNNNTVFNDCLPAGSICSWVINKAHPSPLCVKVKPHGAARNASCYRIHLPHDATMSLGNSWMLIKSWFFESAQIHDVLLEHDNAGIVFYGDDATHTVLLSGQEKRLSAEAEKEIDRLSEQLELVGYEEQARIESYIKYLHELPWNVQTQDNVDLVAAKQILDERHCGLESVKEKILDFLGAQIYRNTQGVVQPDSSVGQRSPVLCLVGPSGVGKTSLARSIADCLNRQYQRISVGGVDDITELKGMMRGYTGALPGRIIQALHRAGSSNPVLLIDELDKIGKASHKGDPAAALLEALDPEQNKEYVDYYVNVGFDLSKVLFVVTANDLSTIAPALLDRMDIIEVPPYSRQEKVEIANRHIIPRVVKELGLGNTVPLISLPVLHELLNDYAAEAGVRELEQVIRTLCTKYARSLLETKQGIIFSPQNLQQYLGAPRVIAMNGVRNKQQSVGCVNGLGWTPIGGKISQAQVKYFKGDGKLLVTGSCGDMLEQSCKVAHSYVRSIAERYKLSSSTFIDNDFHIHFPYVGIPKDGPSFGVAITLAVLSAVTKRSLDGNYAMTGETDICGKVLPVGGLKQKVLAAQEAGIKNVLIPEANKKDIEQFKKDITVKVHYIATIDDAIKLVLK